MPLFHKEEITEGVTLAIWKIDESLATLSALYGPINQDLDALENTKIESKKLEWLAARLALKSLLPNEGFEVRKDEFGKPHLNLSGLEISISHAKGYGAAALSTRGPVGIDIEYERPQILRIAHKFLNPSEQAWASEDTKHLTQIWSAKEALYKLHGRTELIFAEQLKVNSPNPFGASIGEIYEHGKNAAYQLKWQKRADVWCCIAY
jgi:phosphopantetheinyl transferase